MGEKKNSEVNPLDLLNENLASGSKVVENIVKTETGGYDESILGDAPEIDMSLLEDIQLPKSYLLVGLKWLSGAALVFFICSMLFFSFHFGMIGKVLKTNGVMAKLERSNEELLRVKTNVNYYEHLVLKAELDRFSFLGDSFNRYFEVIENETSSNNEKRAAEEKLAILRAEMEQLAVDVRDMLVGDVYLDLFSLDQEESSKVRFVTALKDKLSDTAKDLDVEENAREVRSLKQLRDMVGKSDLRKLFVGAEVASMSSEEFSKFVKEVAEASVNDFNTIDLIKKERVRWSEVMNEIEERTIAIDSYHNDDYYDELGGIRYTSYDFNSGSGQLTLIGETKRFDTANFTMTANLIDELNNSELFSDAEMNTFNKNGSLSDGYTSTLKLTVNLKRDE